MVLRKRADIEAVGTVNTAMREKRVGSELQAYVMGMGVGVESGGGNEDGTCVMGGEVWGGVRRCEEVVVGRWGGEEVGSWGMGGKSGVGVGVFTAAAVSCIEIGAGAVLSAPTSA